MERFTKKMIIFTQHSILDVWHGSEYTSGLLKLFCRGAVAVSEGYAGLLDICETDYYIHSKLRIFPLSRSHTWKYNIQANKRLTLVKEKW